MKYEKCVMECKRKIQLSDISWFNMKKILIIVKLNLGRENIMSDLFSIIVLLTLVEKRIQKSKYIKLKVLCS